MQLRANIIVSLVSFGVASCTSIDENINSTPGAVEVQHSATIPAPEQLDQYRSEFEAAIADGKYPSIAVSVIDDGEVVWRETFGQSDIESGASATVEDVYAVGSLSKSITATVIMSMVEDGLIDLNGLAEDYLDVELMRVQPMDKPRVKDLIHMTGGIPHGHFSPGIGKSDADHYISRFAVQAFPAGKHLLYSNYGYGLLERIAELVDKKPFHQVAKDRVFAPLRMSTARAEGLGNGPYDSTLYDEDKNVIPPYEWRPVSGGGMSFSLTDLEKYVLFHMGIAANADAVLSSATREKMQTTFPDLEAPIVALGLGSLQISENERLLMTSGAIAGGRSAAFMFPAKRDAVIFLTNSRGDSGEVELTTVRVMDTLNPSTFDKAIAIVEAHNAAHYPEFEGQKSFLGSWCGVFKSTNGDRIDAEVEIKSSGKAIVSFNESEPVSAELGLHDAKVSASVFTEHDRMRFNFMPDGDGLIGSVVTTNKDAPLINDMPHVGRMQRCQ
ncbi:MAG: hypothetical protein DHS20C05_06600 [Hyphococcus sp.]|nr:MAG: hypothetical protein DHS20C05_06600 [Marinicaulis sp.]